MEEIAPTVAAPTAQQTSQLQAVAAATEDAEESSANDASALTADFETFLKLLTTQMRNQDPQNPMESTEFIAQLASFSAVEQQITTNEKLDSLISSMSQNSTGQMAGWIGTEVQSTASTTYDGEPVDVFYKLPEGSVTGQVIVSTQSGAEVAKIPVEAGSSKLTWDGKGSDGVLVADGEYTFSVEGFDTKTTLGREPAKTFSTVTEVRLGEDGLSLRFADGSEMSANEVEVIR